MAKKLLNEATIRRFQTLAKVAPINEMYHKRDEDEKMEEAYMEGEGEEVMKEEEEMEMDAEAPAEMEAEEEMGMDGDLELTDDEAQAIIDLGKKLEMAMGDEEPEMDMEMDAEAPEMDMEDEEEVMETMLEGINYQPSKSELINEVAKRVANRLAEAKKAEKRMNEALGRSVKKK